MQSDSLKEVASSSFTKDWDKIGQENECLQADVQSIPSTCLYEIAWSIKSKSLGKCTSLNNRKQSFLELPGVVDRSLN